MQAVKIKYMWKALPHYKFFIPEKTWYNKIESKGSLFISDTTLNETAKDVIQSFLDKYHYLMNKAIGGAVIKKNESE